MKMFKRVMTIIGVGIILLLVVCTVFVSWMVYTQKYEKSELCRYLSPDGKHDVIVYEIGDAYWPFGPVRARLQMVDEDGKAVMDREFWVYNDGTGLEIKNVTSIVWLDTRVEITIRHFDHAATTTYWLPFPVD